MANQNRELSFSVGKPSGFKGLIGVARADITPPVGIYSRNWGAAIADVADGIHWPLVLTCVTFQTSSLDKPLILLSADLAIWGNAKDGKLLRDNIRSAFSIPPENLMFSLSHTHSSPSISRDDINKPGGNYIESYLGIIEQAAINAIRDALLSSNIGILSWKYGKCQLATNRDLPDPVNNRFLVGFNPKQPADDTLLVGRITDVNNKIIGSIVNYACHPTTLGWENTLISPDYIGSMREIVENKTEAPCLFLQGASGDLAPAQQYTGSLEIADKNGRELGYAVLSTLESMLYPGMELYPSSVIESGAPLMVWNQKSYEHSRELRVDMQDITYQLKAIPSLTEIEEQYRNCEDRVIKERLWRQRNIRIAIGEGSSVQMPIWIWKLGDSFLVGQPNEAYSDFQMELRSELFPNTVAVMNLVNGSAGYLPPNKYYHQNIYQVWQTPFDAGSFEQLTKSTKEMVRKMISNK